MSNIIQGIKVRSTTYKYDYNSLENLPAPELPSSTAGDNGKVLAVNSMGNPTWAAPQSELPSYSQSDKGKALFVNTTGHLTWSPAEGALPVIGANDEGKALVVNSTGEPEWETLPSGIPSSTANDSGKALVVNSTGDPAWRDLIPSHNSDYDGSDAGKVLTVATNGSLTWEEGGSGGLSLPDTYNATDGDVLIVHPSTGTLEWGSPFPSYDTTSDVGKVLTITENGPEWVMPS